MERFRNLSCAGRCQASGLYVNGILGSSKNLPQIGRYLKNALLNLDVEPVFEEALEGLGFSLEDLYDEERDAGLGNGG